MSEANHGNLTQRSFQSPTIDHNATNTCEIGNSSRIASVNKSPFPKSNPETMVHQAPKSNKEYINTIAETEPCAPRSTKIAEWIGSLPLVETVQSKFSTESRPFFSETLPQEESRQFGKTESPGIHQESSNTRLAQSLEPCTPYYDLRTASHGYDESMTLNTNIIPLTSIFHNLVSDSLKIQNCQILDSESQPRWNCIKHRPNTRTLITIPTTRLSYDFPTFFLSNTRSMANNLDEISVTITNNKCDIASSQNHGFRQTLRMISLRSPGFHVFAKTDVTTNVVEDYAPISEIH